MIEAYFDCSSPWTYLAFESLEALSREQSVEIAWKPIMVGGIFNTVNPSVYAQRADPVPAKARYMLKDLQDWARYAGLKITFPPRVFPVNSVKAMRGCILVEPDGKLPAFARAAFQAYWSEDLDISQDEVLAEVCRRAGVEPAAFFAGITDPQIKEQLRANTDEAVARGAFGSPTIFIGDDMYFGNDRMPLIREAVIRLRAVSGPPLKTTA
jgi:2-hydroxychromene-2-carboxylate isomerase